MYRFRQWLIMSVALGILLSTTPAQSQTQALREHFDAEWRDFIPDPTINEETLKLVYVFRSTKNGRPIWGLSYPTKLNAVFEVTLVDSKNKVVGGPSIKVNDARLPRPYPRENIPLIWGYHEGRTVQLRVLDPLRRAKSTGIISLKLKDAKTIPALDAPTSSIKT